MSDNDNNDRSNESHRKKRSKLQDVAVEYGRLIDVGPVDPDRRESCRNDLQRFMEIYAKDTFCNPWADYHLDCIAKLMGVILRGLLFAMAVPRGGGKTQLCIWAMIWALLYGHSPFGVLIGANGVIAKKMLKGVKKLLMTTPLLLDDFPEIICPILHLGNEARRTAQQHYNGQLTHIEWDSEKIVFGHLNEVDYGLGFEAVWEVGGLDAANRGKFHIRIDGSTVRPTFSICDDPQTRKSAKSPKQVDYREQLIMSDIRYLGGGSQLNGVAVPCTKIYFDDLADRLTDPKAKPMFRGVCIPMLIAWPKRMDLWEKYGEIQATSFQNGGEGEEATEFYRKNRKAMDAGAKVSWPARVPEGNLSAIQFAMNCFFEDEDAFGSEFQQTPVKAVSYDLFEMPETDILQTRKSMLSPGIVPDDYKKLIHFVDVSEKVLWVHTLAVREDFSGVLIDSGTFPDQKSAYVSLSTVRQPINKLYPMLKVEDAVEQAVDDCVVDLMARQYQDQSGNVVTYDRILVDSGNWTERIYRVVKKYRLKRVWCTKGIGITESRKPLVNYETKEKPNESIEGQLIIDKKKRMILFDTNHWKTYVAQRLLADTKGPGAITFAKFSPRKLRGICDQYVQENARRKFGHGRHVMVWGKEEGDNHYWDCLVGCSVGAFLEGVKMAKPKRRTSAAGRKNSDPTKPKSKPKSRLSSRRSKKR